MLHTTLKLCKEKEACTVGFKILKKSLPKNHSDDDLIPLTHIIKSNGLDDCLWALRATIEDNEHLSRSFAIWCARQSLQYWQAAYPNNRRVRDCIDTAERFNDGIATEKEMATARSAASSAAQSAACSAAEFAASSAAEFAARSTAEFAAWSAASSAAWSAESAARSAASSAASSAAWSAEFAARSTAEFAAWSAAWSASSSAQTNQLIKMLENHEV